MSITRIKVALFLALGIVASIAVIAQVKQTDDVLIIERPVDHDLYAAQREINLRSAVNGDFVVAGQSVTVNGKVAGDVIAAAQNINIRSEVSDDVRAAGLQVRVTAPISGHIVAAAQTIIIEQSVGDWVWLAGNTVEVLGNVGSTLKVIAKNITINGEVAGNVDLIGEQLQVGPKAVIRGDLKWRSQNEVTIDPNAQIDGEIIEQPLPGLVEELSTGGRYFLPLNIIVAAMMMFLLFSEMLRTCTERVTSRPGGSLLLGLAVLCVTPFLAVFLFATGVGAWLGFAVLFVFLVLLMLGMVTGLIVVSDIALRKMRPQPTMWQSLAAIFVTVVAVSILTKVPWLGFILVIAILLLGLGALCWNTWAAQRSVDYRVPQTS